MAIVSACSVFVEFKWSRSHEGSRSLPCHSRTRAHWLQLAAVSSLNYYTHTCRRRARECLILVRSKVHYVGSLNNTGSIGAQRALLLDQSLHLTHQLGRLLESPHPILFDRFWTSSAINRHTKGKRPKVSRGPPCYLCQAVGTELGWSQAPYAKSLKQPASRMRDNDRSF